MMNRDDDIELLDSSVKKEKTTDLSNKDDLASDMLGNQILSSIDSSHQAVHSNDYFTSNTSSNLSSSSHDNAQTNFNSLDSIVVSSNISSMDSTVQSVPTPSTTSVPSNHVNPLLQSSYHATNHTIPTNNVGSSVSISNNDTVPSNHSSTSMTTNGTSSDYKSNVSTDSDANASKPTKPIVLLIIFLVLLLVIIFLPYIGDFFNKLIPDTSTSTEVSKIENGSLTCTLEHEKDNVSYYYTDTYDFKNRKVENLQHVVSIQSGTDFLNMRNAECQNLRQASAHISGISVECNLSSGEMVETQFFNFKSLQDSNVSTEFVEAGGVYPNVEYGDDISEVEKNLTISGYECRES